MPSHCKFFGKIILSLSAHTLTLQTPKEISSVMLLCSTISKVMSTSFSYDLMKIPRKERATVCSYYVCVPSTLELLDNVSTQQTPKVAVHTISSRLGGVLHAESAGALPRNQQQAKDKRHKTNATSSHPLLSVMMMCKQTMKGFVRNSRGAPDYIIVIAKDHTLDNLVLFCTAAS